MILADYLADCYQELAGLGVHAGAGARFAAAIERDPGLLADATARLAQIRALLAILPGGEEDLTRRDHLSAQHLKILKAALPAR